jgi:hypothetical protein
MTRTTDVAVLIAVKFGCSLHAQIRPQGTPPTLAQFSASIKDLGISREHRVPLSFRSQCEAEPRCRRAMCDKPVSSPIAGRRDAVRSA